MKVKIQTMLGDIVVRLYDETPIHRDNFLKLAKEGYENSRHWIDIMEYRKIGDNYYIRMDRGDEIISNLLLICEKESIPSAVFSGIGGCQSAELQVFIPETGSFETEQLEGMLELVSINGNVVRDDDGKLFHHTHALFSFKGRNRDVDNIVGGYQDGQHGVAGGHLKSTTVLYTAEIELRPTVGGAIGRKFDPETGTGFWAFKD